MDESYIPTPFPEEKMEPVEWRHVLATLNVCTLNHRIKFCDEEGYDIMPILMIRTINHHTLNEGSIEDLTLSCGDTAEDELEFPMAENFDSDEDFDVPKSELEKVRMLLKGRDRVQLEIPKSKPSRKFCQSHRKFRKQALKQKKQKKQKEREESENKQSEAP